MFNSLSHSNTFPTFLSSTVDPFTLNRTGIENEKTTQQAKTEANPHHFCLHLFPVEPVHLTAMRYQWLIYDEKKVNGEDNYEPGEEPNVGLEQIPYFY